MEKKFHSRFFLTSTKKKEVVGRDGIYSICNGNLVVCRRSALVDENRMHVTNVLIGQKRISVGG